MGFAPVIASEKIVNKYKRYLSTIFEIADKKYADQFKTVLADQDSFAVGPFLDVTDSFVKGSSLSDLIENGHLRNALNQ